MRSVAPVPVILIFFIGCLSTQTWQDGIHIPEDVLYRDYICSQESTERVYYLFWGLLALNYPAEQFDPSEKSLLLIKQDTTGFDIGFSIIMGTLFSMSSKTMNIEKCINAGTGGSVLPESLSPEARRRMEEAKKRRQQNR